MVMPRFRPSTRLSWYARRRMYRHGYRAVRELDEALGCGTAFAVVLIGIPLVVFVAWFAVTMPWVFLATAVVIVALFILSQIANKALEARVATFYKADSSDVRPEFIIDHWDDFAGVERPHEERLD